MKTKTIILRTGLEVLQTTKDGVSKITVGKISDSAYASKNYNRIKSL